MINCNTKVVFHKNYKNCAKLAKQEKTLKLVEQHLIPLICKLRHVSETLHSVEHGISEFPLRL